MFDYISKNPKKFSFTAGVCSVAALPPYSLWPILFLSFGLLFCLLNRAASKKDTFFCGYWFGFGYFSVGLAWVGNALLIDWQTFGWLYPVVPLAAGGFFGLFTAFPCLLSGLFKAPVEKYLSLPAFMTIFEWLRSFILTGFPWNPFGSVWCWSDYAIQAASLFGIYGLSWLSWMIFAAPSLLLLPVSKTVKISAIAIPLAGISFLFCFGIWRLSDIPQPETTLSIRIVQPSIPQSLKWNRAHLEKNFADYISLSTQKPLDGVDFVIWGETASPFALDADPEHLRQILPAVPPHGRLITGMVRYEITPYEHYRLYNSMAVIAANGSIEASYDKSHLVPFGEYIPLKKYLPDWIRPITEAIGEFQTGSGPVPLKIRGFPDVGGLICYEVIFPGEVVDKNKRPQWLVNLTNDGWYGASAGPYQHLETARLRAVEEGLPIIRSANSGISAAIDAYGRIIAKNPLNQRIYLDVSLPLPADLSTTYGKFCNILPLILCLLNILLAFYFSKRKLIKSVFS